MQYNSLSLSLDVLVRQLQLLDARVELSPGSALGDAGAVQQYLGSACKLPADFLSFLQHRDGVRLSYRLPHTLPDRPPVPVGSFEICASRHLRAVPATVVVDCGDGRGLVEVSATAVPFEVVPDFGVVALVYVSGGGGGGGDGGGGGGGGGVGAPTVWLRDLLQDWHYVCRTFTCYYRLAMMHMAVARWQVRCARRKDARDGTFLFLLRVLCC
jgi:hypothetical protein